MLVLNVDFEIVLLELDSLDFGVDFLQEIAESHLDSGVRVFVFRVIGVRLLARVFALLGFAGNLSGFGTVGGRLKNIQLFFLLIKFLADLLEMGIEFVEDLGFLILL